MSRSLKAAKGSSGHCSGLFLTVHQAAPKTLLVGVGRSRGEERRLELCLTLCLTPRLDALCS